MGIPWPRGAGRPDRPNTGSPVSGRRRGAADRLWSVWSAGATAHRVGNLTALHNSGGRDGTGLRCPPPFFVRAARIGFDAIDPQLEEAATTEGASQWQLFRHVMLPLAGRSVLSGLVLCWTRALGEFGATILFAGNMAGRTQTMPLAIYLGFERDVGVALALSVLLLLVSTLLLLAIRSLERNALERG
ncbi:MAG: ABC transporter permease subunit [Chloroflexi bacterium]|nr:ABC transporter permease subunit [Chloroflexota bacterium]